MDLGAGPTRKVIRRTSRLCNTHAPPRRDRGCQDTCLYIPLAYVCPSVLSRERLRMALSKVGKNMLERTRRIGQAWVVIYFTDQLLTPCSKYFSGASTLNGTPGGDRWARVLGGQIGWLSEPRHRFEADALGLRMNLKMQTQSTKKSASPTTHHKSHSSPATATTSRQTAKKRAPQVSPYSPASMDTGFVEIGLVQLSQSVKTTNVTHAHTASQTN